MNEILGVPLSEGLSQNSSPMEPVIDENLDTTKNSASQKTDLKGQDLLSPKNILNPPGLRSTENQTQTTNETSAFPRTKMGLKQSFGTKSSFAISATKQSLMESL